MPQTTHKWHLPYSQTVPPTRLYKLNFTNNEMENQMLRKMILIAAIALVPLLSPAANAGREAKLVEENLQQAFNGESNAHAKYLAYAEKADGEGYGQVASLFRAAAKAEDIHASNHAAVLKKMGITPVAKIELPEIKATAENLKAAIAGESYERDKMYPEFIGNAKTAKNTDAVRTLVLARNAETEHAKLYADSLAKLTSLKGSGKMNYYVCSVCGYTAPSLPAKKCPSSFSPLDKFIVIN